MSEPETRGDESDDGGAVGRFFHSLFGKSWKTTVTGGAALVFSVAPLVPGIPHSIVDFCRNAAPFVLGGGLLFAKDHNVSGGKKPPGVQP